MFSKVTSAIRNESARKQARQENIARIAISEDGQIAYASSAFCALSHREAGELKNARAMDLISFLEGPRASAGVGQIKAGLHKIYINGHKEPMSFHFDWLSTPDNKRYLIGSENLGNKKPDRATIEQMAGMIQPTQQGFSIEDLERLMNISHEAMIVVNDLGEIEQANTTFRRIFGYQDRDLQRLHFLDLFDEADKPHINNALQALDPGEENNAPSQNFEARILTKSGDVRWMQWQQQLVGNKLYCSGRDVTDIKNQEKALLRRENQLTEAESIARMGHWHWTIGATEMEWSAELYRIFGVEEGEFKPTLESMNKMVHRGDISRLNQAFQRALIEENDYDMEFRIITKSGDTRFIRCEGRCAADPSGEVYALYGIMQDMTERVLYEGELKAAKETAERAYAARTQFLANMSHELRTPLNAIIGFSEMMQHQLLGPIGSEKYLEYIGGIRESGEHLLDLISDILDMSKIEAGKYDLDLTEVQPGKLVKLAIHMMEGRAHEAKVKIQAAKHIDENFKIVADRRAVLQILLNLLSNAVKFTKQGGEVMVELLQKENNCWIKVIDNGIGIPANKLATITKPFEQVSSSYTRNHQGSGLGLAITKELAEMHGGSLFIESAYGKGTSVTIKLPKKPQS